MSKSKVAIVFLSALFSMSSVFTALAESNHNEKEVITHDQVAKTQKSEKHKHKDHSKNHKHEQESQEHTQKHTKE